MLQLAFYSPRVGLLAAGLLGSRLLAAQPVGAPAPTGPVAAPLATAAAPVRLAVGQPLAGTVAGDETRTYVFPLEARQVAHVVVEQQGVDVVLTVLAPGGQPLAEMDSPIGNQGPESVWLAAAAAGDYRVRVRPFTKAGAGAYTVRLAAARDATPADGQRLQAQGLVAEGLAQRQRLTPQAGRAERQAVAGKFEAARALWQQLGEAGDAHLAGRLATALDPTSILRAAGLPTIAGNMRAYYSRGAEARARAWRADFEQGAAFFSAWLGIKPDIDLAILNEADWQLISPNIPYGGPHSLAGLVVLPATSDFSHGAAALLSRGLTPAQRQAAEAAKTGGRTVEQRLDDYFHDLGYHEMGHLYERALGLGPSGHWLNEFFANYLLYAYLREKQPARADNLLVASTLFQQGVRPNYTSLADFDRVYMDMPPGNYGWYQGAFTRQAAAVYATEKRGFIAKLKAAFPPGAPPQRLTTDEVVQRLEAFSPGFGAWAWQLAVPTAASGPAK